MKLNKLIITFIVISQITTISIFSGCIKQDIQLDGVEVREYQGEKLSSVNDFNENSIKGTQQVNKTTYRLKITGLIETQKNYTYNEVLDNFQHYKKAVKLDCVEGWSVNILWEGVLVSDLINDSKPDPFAQILIFKAQDGYTTSLPLVYINQKKILLAYKMNNVTIPPERGFPFQLVAESKWGYKWIRWVTEIEVSNNTQYKGYWESRGYSNIADINQSFFGK